MTSLPSPSAFVRLFGDQSSRPLPTSAPSWRDVAKGIRNGRLADLLLPDPDQFVAGCVNASRLELWREIAQFSPDPARIMRWISEGVSVHEFWDPKSKARPQHTVEPNHSIDGEFLPFIEQYNKDAIRSGAAMVVGPVGKVEPPFLVHPVGLEPTKPRRLGDARYLNSFQSPPKFKLEGLATMPRWVRKLLSVIDIAKCFMNIPLHPDSWSFFGYRATLDGVDVWCQSKVLIFGWNCAPFVCDMLTSAIARYLRALGIACQVFYDDFAVDADHSSDEQVENNAFVVLGLLADLGFYVGRKSAAHPSPCPKYLGFLVDCQNRRYILPPDKRDNFLILLRFVLATAPGTQLHISILERLAGKCAHIADVLQGARAFIRVQYETIQSVLETASRRRGTFAVTRALRAELHEWEFLDPSLPTGERWDGALWLTEFHNRVRFHLSTDACSHGFGGALQILDPNAPVFWHAELLDPSRRDRIRVEGGLLPAKYQRVNGCHINVQEMYAVFHVVSSFDAVLSNQFVDIYTDSQVVHDCLTSGSSRTNDINSILTNLWRLCRRYGIRLRSHHIPGTTNVVADTISRLEVATYNRISDAAWDRITAASPSRAFWNMDGMASAEDSRCPRHISYFNDDRAHWVNLFSYKFKTTDRVYLYPPFAMVDATISFMKDCGCSWMVVVPYKQENWWLWLKKNTSKPPLLLGRAGDQDVCLGLDKASGLFTPVPLPLDFYAFFFIID